MSPDYVLDDPNEGRIPRSEFVAYFEELKRTLDGIRGGPPAANTLDLSEVVTQEEGGVLTAWCWWTFPGHPDRRERPDQGRRRGRPLRAPRLLHATVFVTGRECPARSLHAQPQNERRGGNGHR
jgi:hypothetical protein